MNRRRFDTTPARLEVLSRDYESPNTEAEPLTDIDASIVSDFWEPGPFIMSVSMAGGRLSVRLRGSVGGRRVVRSQSINQAGRRPAGLLPVSASLSLSFAHL